MLIPSPRVLLLVSPPPDDDEPIVSARALRMSSPRSLRLLKLTERPVLPPAAMTAVDGERERSTGRRSNLSSSNFGRGAMGIGALSETAAVESETALASLACC